MESPDEREMIEYCLMASGQEPYNTLFIPSAFPQALPDFFLDYRTRLTTYFVLKFDFLPTDFRFRLTYWLLNAGKARILANRLPIVLGMDGNVMQINYYPEKRELHILLTLPEGNNPRFYESLKESGLATILMRNWEEVLSHGSSHSTESNTDGAWVSEGSAEWDEEIKEVGVPGFNRSQLKTLIKKISEAVKSSTTHYPYPVSFTSKTLHIPAHATPALDMVLVPGGTFTMGDVMGDKEYDFELPLHEVTLDSFRMGRFAVTFDEYDAFCVATGREKPSDQSWGRGRRPVINVSWYDAVEYCNWLSEIWQLDPAYSIDKNKQDPNNTSDNDKQKWLVTFNPKARGYRLPTEAQWEYAAREGGKKVRFGNGKGVADPKEINFDGSKEYKKSYSIEGEYRRKTLPGGSLNSPNELGLHDMSGNVWEWCWDWFGKYSSDAQTDPTGTLGSSDRVFRGGGWGDNPQDCRVAARGSVNAPGRGGDLGFRLVLPPVSSE
ncbi:MAG: formylglycine-generating enzyme family protein [Lewinellaceae bacterium]|nr:formylglycine-generating enzyme family protein [Lewinellaceae bacterium]